MLIADIVFYMLSTVMLLSAVLVVAARNPVHSVLFLILAFFNAAGLFLLLGAEFLAMLLVIVYVGAVAVLFLFVVMILDVNFQRLRKGVVAYVPIALAVGAALIAELVIVIGAAVRTPELIRPAAAPLEAAGMSNTRALGTLIYTEFLYIFQASGLILLVAMIGAIVLTLRSREGAKKQSVPDQVARTRDQAVEVKKVKVGEGI